MRQPGMAVVSSSGDDGFLGDESQWPQNLPTVTSAGGTSLYADKTATKRGFREVAWNGAGSGCSTGLAPASGQHARIAKVIGQLPSWQLWQTPTPASLFYDSYAPGTGAPSGFIVVGGTSASSPFIAGLYARAKTSSKLLGPNTIYAAGESAFHDITIGANAGVGMCEITGYRKNLCDATARWDGPTGLGAPEGLKPFTYKNNL